MNIYVSDSTLSEDFCQNENRLTTPHLNPSWLLIVVDGPGTKKNIQSCQKYHEYQENVQVKEQKKEERSIQSG